MRCYMDNCVNNDQWACMYRDECDDCSRGCKNYYKCSSCDYYMDEDIEKEEILFPWQYINEYILGESSFDYAINRTIDEVYRLIGEYIHNHKIEEES